MGVVLLLGFALVIGRIVQLMNRSSAAQDAQSAAPAAAGLAPEARLALPAGAVIRTMSLAGNRLAVHYDSPAGGGIAIVDLASGRVVQRIQIGPAL
jgi:hypothetical protein